MNRNKSILSFLFFIFLFLGNQIHSQTTYNPSAQNTTEYTTDQTTNHFFYFPSGSDELDINVSLNKLQFTDNSGNTYGWDGGNAIPTNWDFEILTDLSNCPDCTVTGKKITYSGDPDETISVKLRIFDKDASGNPTIANSNTMGSVDISYRIISRLTTVSKQFNSCTGKYEILIKETSISGNKPCSPYTIKVYSGASDQSNLVFESVNQTSPKFELDLDTGNYNYVITDSCNQTLAGVFTIDEAYTFSADVTFSGYKCHDDSSSTVDINIEGAAWPVSWTINEKSGTGTPSYSLSSTNTSQYTTEGLSSNVDTDDIVNYSILVQGIPNGTYIFTFSDNYGCEKQQEFTVVRPPELTATLDASVQELACNGDSNGSLTFTGKGGWTQPFDGNNIRSVWGAEYSFILTKQGTTSTFNHGTISYSFDADGNRIGYKTTFSNLSAGTYCLTLSETIETNPNNSSVVYSCSNEAGCFTIGEPDELGTSANITNIACNGNETGSIDLSVSGGTANYTYAWTKTGDNSFSATTQDLSNLSPGTYNVTVTDANDCTTTNSFEITEPAELLIADAGLSTEIACFGDNGQIRVNVTQASVANYTYALYQGNSVVQTVTNSNLNHTFNAAAGTYKVRVTDANGCFKETNNITLTQPDAALSISNETINNIDCKDQDNGSIDITVAGGTANYTYAWIKTGDNSYSATSQDLSSLSPGTYNVTITDANNCTLTKSFTITEPDQLVSSGTISNFNGFGISCNGADDGSIDLSVSGGTANYSYSWFTNDGSGLSINSQDQSGLGPGTYGVTVTDANGCTSLPLSFTITEPSQLSISSSIPKTNGFSISCFGANDGAIDITPSGGSSNYTYNWSTSNGSGLVQGQQDQSGLGPGLYTLTLVDSNNCSVTQTFTLTQPDDITLSGNLSNYNGFQISKKGASDGTIDLSVSGGNLLSGQTYTYLWTTSNGSGLDSSSQDQTGLTAGTYTIKVTDSNGCFETQVFVLNEPEELDFSFNKSNFNGFGISCFGANDGSIDITPSGGSGSYTYNWTTSNGSGLNQGQQDQTGLSPGTYNLIITDSNGNTTTGSFLITEPSEVSLSSSLSNYNNFQVSCYSGTDGSINITPAGGTGLYTYNWSTSNGSGLVQGQQDQSGLSAGNYSVTVTDSNGCSIVSNFSLTSPTQINLSSSLSNYNGFNITCNGEDDGSIDISVSGGLLLSGANYSYSWTTSDGSGLNPNSEDQIGLTAGTYTVTVTDSNSCILIESITLNESEPINIIETISDYNGFQISQNGANDGSISLDVSGGTNNYTYSWTKTGDSSFTSTNKDLNNLSIGIYTVVVTDSNGCIQTESYNLSQPAQLLIGIDISAFATNVLCYGDNTASIKIDITQASVGPYTYDLFGTDYLNQQYTQTANNINNLTYTFNSIPAGEYQVKVTDANGSSKTSQTRVITQPNAPITITSSISDYGSYNISCFGANDASINLSIQGGTLSGNNFYQYQWTTNNGSGLDINSLNQTGLGPGDYTILVTDENNCTLTETYSIISPEALNYVLDEKKNITCKDDADGSIQISVSGGTGNYNYNWTTVNGTGLVQGQQDQTGLGPGIYSLILSDGCESIQYEYIISEPDELTITLDEKTDILCHNDSTGKIFVTVSGGTQPYDYVWKDNFGNVYDRDVGNVFNTGNLSNIPAGIYDLTVTDANNCVTTFNIELTQPDDLLIDIFKTDLNCYDGNDGTITVTPSGGVAPYSYTWSDLGNGNIRTGLAAGSYSVTITDSNNCVEIREIEIQNAELFDINPVVIPVSCFGADDGSIELNFVGGVSPVLITWSDDPSAGQNRYNLSPGIYSVLIEDASGCKIDQSFTIIEPQELSIAGVVTDAIDCDNPASGSIDLQISGGNPPYTFQWSNGATSEDLTNLIANNYLVIVTDSKGCTAQKEFTINRQEDLEINLETSLYAICETREVYQKNIVSVSGGVAPYIIEWSNGIVTGNNNEIMDTKIEGSYQVTVTDALGCSESIIFDVSTPEIGFPDFSYDSFYLSTYGALAVNDAITFTNLSTEQYFNVFWDFGDGNSSQEINPSNTYTKRGVYEVTLTVEFILGCSYSITKTIYVGDSYEIVIPNAFTPNNDGYNDTFRPVYYGFKYLKMQIFDTWGNLIYSEESTSNELIGWSGRIGSKDGENGNYFYQVSGNTHTDEKFSKNGAFTLIK